MWWVFALWGCTTGGAPVAEQVQVTDARARAMPPGTPNSGGFLTLRSAVDADLVSASAPVSRAVELHTHVNDDGILRMRQIPSIPLPAGEEVVLKPGSLHVMFIGLTDTLEPGETFPLTLTFGDGSTKRVDMPVQTIGAGHSH